MKKYYDVEMRICNFNEGDGDGYRESNSLRQIQENGFVYAEDEEDVLWQIDWDQVLGPGDKVSEEFAKKAQCYNHMWEPEDGDYNEFFGNGFGNPVDIACEDGIQLQVLVERKDFDVHGEEMCKQVLQDSEKWMPKVNDDFSYLADAYCCADYAGNSVEAEKVRAVVKKFVKQLSDEFELDQN